jgi:hypothetical protein
MTKPILAALAASLLVAGCAMDPVDAKNETRAEPEYRTGSNIAVKRHEGPSDGPTTVSREEAERVMRSGQFPSPNVPKGN